eukprot:1159235-Pelagomonas_calceolata.AAC.21
MAAFTTSCRASVAAILDEVHSRNKSKAQKRRLFRESIRSHYLHLRCGMDSVLDSVQHNRHKRDPWKFAHYLQQKMLSASPHGQGGEHPAGSIELGADDVHARVEV